MNRPILWIATANQHKAEEYQTLLPNYEIKTLKDLPFSYEEPEENGKSFADNALIKARDLAKKLNQPVVGDDSGIVVNALDDFPGIYSRRWALPLTDWPSICEKLITKVKESKTPLNQKAAMVTVLAWYEPQTHKSAIFEGQTEGQLNNQIEMGDGRCFGYDLIFKPENEKLTYSQMSIAEKTKTSARQRAIKKLLHFLELKEEK